MRTNKFNTLYEFIIKESTNTNSPSLSKFLWKNNRYLRQLRNSDLAKEIGEKVIKSLIEEFSQNINKEYEIEFPGKGDDKVKILKVSDDGEFLHYEGKHPYIPERIEERKTIIGMLMTDKSYDLMFSLMKPTIDKLKEQSKIDFQKKKEEAEIAAKEKRSTYESDDVKKYIKSIPSEIIGNYAWNGRPLPNDFKEDFSKLPENIKIGFINYVDDMKYHDETMEYIDLGYYSAKAKEDAANSRLKKLVEELRNL